ncbi:MAG: helix-turn-helix domain-containing protein [Pseudomonadota bacterium]|nr:helix-turn-helix domain-containing protein [Pseudomonadota bacterium]
MPFGASLRLLRVEAGLSLKSLGHSIGVSTAYLSRVENGHDAPPTPDRLRSIADVLGLPVDLLLDLTGRARVAEAPSLVGRALLEEVVRRKLGPAQIARVLDFIAREFPEGAAPSARIADLLTPDRVLLGVRVGRVEDTLDLAAMRLAPPGAPESLVAALAAALHARERAAPSAVGGGLLLPHAPDLAPAPTACLVLLDTPCAGLHGGAPLPDDAPIRAVLVLVGIGHGAPGLAVLARAARLADPELLGQLASAGSAREVLASLALVR